MAVSVTSRTLAASFHGIGFQIAKSQSEAMDKLAQQLKELENATEAPSEEDLRYIG